jgi:glutathione S-transferase
MHDYGDLARLGYSSAMRIIGSYVSPYVRKVLACLNLKGLAYEIDPITPFFGGDEFERLSPLRRIPVFLDGELTLTDSSVICEYLDEAHGGHRLLPTAPADRARARWLEEYADTRLGDIFIWGLFYQRYVHPMVWREAGDEARAQRMVDAEIPKTLDYLERQLPDEGFLFGDIGIADIAIAAPFPNAAHVGFTPASERWPRVAAFVERTLQHPCLAVLRPFEQVQLATDIRKRRQALLDAGAPLTAESLGTREPRKGVMRL